MSEPITFLIGGGLLILSICAVTFAVERGEGLIEAGRKRIGKSIF